VAPKVEGTMRRDNWCFEVTDARLIPREYLAIDTVKIGQVVRAMKGSTSIPGIRVYNDPKVYAR
jgi:hypothetical protein